MPGLLSQASNQAAGLTRGLLYGGLGAPVDLANMMLLGAGGQRPVGGSAWLEGKIDPYLSRMIGQPNVGQNAARLVGDVVAPGPGEFAGATKAMQGLLADPATATKLQQMVGGLLGMTAYHGSPHKFDKFKLSDKTIGTGEGAQAYGYGLYFAESPELAGQYKASTSANMYDTSKGVIRSSDLVDELFKQSGDIPKNLESAYRAKANEVVRDLIMGKSSSEISQEIRTSKYRRTYNALADAVDNLSPKSASGQMYSVDIPDEQIGKMLDWDKPLSEQRAALDAFRKAGIAQYDSLDSYLRANKIDFNTLSPDEKWKVASRYQDESGLASFKADIAYKQLAKKLGGEEAASKYLRDNGIPGIRYLDGSSRAAGEGTRNFVVFDDSIIKILNRE